MPKIINLVGKRYGKLIVLEISHKGKNRSYYWKCLCDCGEITIINGSNLRGGTTLSCGCLLKERLNEYFEPFRQAEIGKIYWNSQILNVFMFEGNCFAKILCFCGQVFETMLKDFKFGSIKSCGCLKKLKEGESNFNRLFDRYKRDATKNSRNYEFSLTKEEFKKLTSSNCFYCDIEPSNIQKKVSLNGNYKYNGVDRLDNSKGYFLENCVSSCTFCNFIKGRLTILQWKEKLKRIKNIDFDNLQKDLKNQPNKQFLKKLFWRQIVRRNISYDLNMIDFKSLIFSNCYYCKAEPSNVYNKKLIYQGIDRIDNSRGYTFDNCVPCCKECNQAKNKYNLEYFLDKIKKLQFNISKKPELCL